VEAKIFRAGLPAGGGVVMNYQTIGSKFRAARKRLGLSQFAVAKEMGCSRAQVDNIEVARQRAPLHRLEDFARVVGLRLFVQLAPRSEKPITVRTTGDALELMDGLNELSEDDARLVAKLVQILPDLPDSIRATLSGIITLWSDRYTGKENGDAETA